MTTQELIDLIRPLLVVPEIDPAHCTQRGVYVGPQLTDDSSRKPAQNTPQARVFIA